ncbi:subunit 4 of oligomeric Golgi complex [Chloropicon primus]|uniref:Conserved oligomeric Golgi complex subunit 4 n=2 Tax=Chloropicon primus TaxID=1764295 RepID=A0A5B8MRN3_9CHLO|nr:subunit 4 of oligomeric Golgi complex [Chloropicon primus]UPR01290.1 subunit 4 of oligomeric Golgi complex [Chloropicon primus]|eukprot:QDZ22070.1 subunit 4 of oligomeric Golgi complex [Chloropicon primus]
MTAVTEGSGQGQGLNPVELLQQAERVSNVQEASALLSEAILCEKQVDNHLNDILSKRNTLERGLANLKDSLGLLDLMQKHAESIAGSTKQASSLAEDVSRRVRELDASQSRVSEAMRRLDCVVDAERAVEELKEALSEGEYDKAAERIQTFTQLYFAVGVKSGSAASTAGAQAESQGDQTPNGGLEGQRQGRSNKGSILSEGDESSSHVLRESAKVVKECAKNLREVVLEKFEKAAKERDHDQVKRFASILGPIGLVESGLQAFTKYLIGLISSRATSEYDNLLAEISIPKNLESERKADFNAALTGLYRDIAEAIEANTQLITEAYGQEGFVDVVLSLHQEAETRAVQILRKFVEYRQLARAIESKGEVGSSGGDNVTSFERTIDEVVMLCMRSEEYNNCIKMVLSTAAEQGVEKASSTINSLGGSPLNCVVRELNAYYTGLEDNYMERTIQMAIQMDECVDGALTSSLVEDAFFILQKCGRRGMATGNVQCVCSVLNNINNHLCNAFLSALRHDNSVYECLVGSPEEGLDLEAIDNTSNTAKAAQAVNNFDVSSEYIKKLKADLDMYTFEVFESTDSRNRVQSCLSDLLRTSQEFEKISASTIEYVALKLMPELRPSIDALSSLSFNLSDSEYAMYEAEDPWLSDFLSRMEEHLGWLRGLLTSQNYEALVHSVLGHTAKRIEALLLQKRFNQLGGLLLEKDVRNMVNYTSNMTQRTVRDKFARLTQMATLLNLESPQEVLDYWGDESMMWRLTPFEVKRALKLRVEFRAVEVDGLDLT